MAAPVPAWTSGPAGDDVVSADVVAQRAVLVADRGRLADLRVLAARRRARTRA